MNNTHNDVLHLYIDMKLILRYKRESRSLAKPTHSIQKQAAGSGIMSKQQSRCPESKQYYLVTMINSQRYIEMKRIPYDAQNPGLVHLSKL
jgi:hypothetical protein